MIRNDGVRLLRIMLINTQERNSPAD